MPDPATIDPVTMKLLGKLKILAKHTKTNIDLVKMTDGSGYAEQILQELGHSDNEEIVLIALKLMNRMRLIEAPVDIVLEQAAEENERDSNIKGAA